MSKKKQQLPKKGAVKSKAKANAPHKTLKKTVQQTGKSAAAESISDIGKGKKVADVKNKRAGSENSVKNRLLPPVLAEFEKDAKAGVRRAIGDIAAIAGFDAKQVLKYVSHYEKDAYVDWKSLPKDNAGSTGKAGKAEKRASKKEQKPKVADIPEEEETSVE